MSREDVLRELERFEATSQTSRMRLGRSSEVKGGSPRSGSQSVVKGGVVVRESPIQGRPECACPLFFTTAAETGPESPLISFNIPSDIAALEDTIRVRLIEDRPRPGVKVTSSAQAAGLVRDLQDEAQEVGRVLYLDTRGRVIGVQTLFKGGTDVTILEPLSVIRGAALLNATQAVVAHNHPSGDPTPSAQDYEAFKLMKQGLASANLKLLDFLVIGRGQFISMSTDSKGLLT